MGAVESWLLAAEADLRAARTLADAGHALHAVFTCHPAIEKALKAFVQAKTGAVPPRTHHLMALSALGEIDVPGPRRATVAALSGVSAAVRYVLDLEEAGKQFPPERVARFLDDAEEILRWARSILA